MDWAIWRIFRQIELDLGQHKLIEIVRAAIGNPPLLLLDEPAVGLTTEEVARLAESPSSAEIPRDGNSRRRAQRRFVATIADEVVVMESGRLIASRQPPGRYGRSKSKRCVSGSARMTAVLQVASLAGGYGRLTVFRDVDLALEQGQTVGLLGANGAGKTTLLKPLLALCGVVQEAYCSKART